MDSGGDEELASALRLGDLGPPCSQIFLDNDMKGMWNPDQMDPNNSSLLPHCNVLNPSSGSSSQASSPNRGTGIKAASLKRPTSTSPVFDENVTRQLLPGMASMSRSGRHIEWLMTENDRLRHELSVEKSAKEEAHRRIAAQRAIIDRIGTEKENLITIHETESRMLEKKDQKILDLKIKLEAEVDRRQAAEKQGTEMANQLDNTITAASKEIASHKWEKKLAEVHAEAVGSGIKRIDEKHSETVKKLRIELNEMLQERREDREKLMALEIVGDQQRQEIERGGEHVRQMTFIMDSYKKSMLETIWMMTTEGEEMKALVGQKLTDIEETEKTMREVNDRMKWAMALHKDRAQNGVSNRSSGT